VTYEEEPGLATQTEEQETFLGSRMLIVKELDGEFIVEDGLGLFEGDPVFLEIHDCLDVVPLEPNDQYIVLQEITGSRGPTDRA